MFPIPSFENSIRLKKRPTKEVFDSLVLFFNSWVVYHLMGVIHREFLIKSKGGVDSVGIKWLPLSESRRVYKPLQRGERTLYQIGRRKRSKKVLLADRNPPINIDTRRLLNSLRPGVVARGVYTPRSEDQIVTVNTRSVSIKILVPCAGEVQAIRPYHPDDIDQWLSEAVQMALPNLKLELLKKGLI